MAAGQTSPSAAGSAIERHVETLCRAARAAARQMALAPTDVKNTALLAAAARLRDGEQALLDANAIDVERARAAGLSGALVDRLALTPQRIDAMAAGLEQIAALPDPVGETIAQWRRPNGLEITQVRVPLGVVGVIYESRPNVTADAAGLCLKSGNATVLRGGSEAKESNAAITDAVAAAVTAAGLPPGALQALREGGREAAQALLRQDRYIDVIIPRGGESLIRTVTEMSTIPVIQHFAGVCTTYVDAAADLEMAERICLNAKVQRPGVCNAMENLLVHRDVAARFLPRIGRRFREAGVEIRGCERTRSIVPDAVAATAADWTTEYLDLIIAVKVVDSLDEAVEFINTNGSGHSDAIVTDSYDSARTFQLAVDATAVFVNASTRFNDGFEFGFGAEIGISTNRLHARGPMGLRELTTYKYTIRGSGQIRE
jgi:glutamate-5-semialdehyde dehydrogenase